MTEPDDPIVGMHYKLYAYVCGEGCVKPSPFKDHVTFTKIFQSRPNKCRFAVAQRVPLLRNPSKDPNTPLVWSGTPTGPYVVWDLLDHLLVTGKRTGPGGVVAPPAPIWMGSSEQGMVMKALTLYDHVG